MSHCSMGKSLKRSKYRGVSYHRTACCWKACITVAGRQFTVYSSHHEELCADAFDAAKIRLRRFSSRCTMLTKPWQVPGLNLCHLLDEDRDEAGIVAYVKNYSAVVGTINATVERHHLFKDPLIRGMSGRLADTLERIASTLDCPITRERVPALHLRDVDARLQKLEAIVKELRNRGLPEGVEYAEGGGQ